MWRKTKFAVIILFIASLLPQIQAQVSIKETQKPHQMEQKILGLRTVIYLVDDLAAAKEWYSKAFEKEAYFSEPFYVGFNIGGYELGLLPVETEQLTRGENVLAYWGVTDIAKTYHRMIELGASVHEEPHNVGGPLEVASVKDPWGNCIGLIFNPVFKLEE